MTWLFFGIAVAMILYVGTNTAEIYTKEANSVRTTYLTEHEEEFHRFHISSNKALAKVKEEKAGDHKVLASFFWISLVLFIVTGVIVAKIDEKKFSGVAILISMVWLTWGYLSAVFSSSIANSGVKEHVCKRLESFRCPHCHAPLSYFETETYNDGEVYFQKRAKKYDFDLKMNIYVNENWVRYNEHHIFTCDYCHQRDDEVKEKEEKFDKPSLSSLFGRVTEG